MQSFFHGTLFYDSGYFHVWISSAKQLPFFASDHDKAFFMTLLQDNLSPRNSLSEVYGTPSTRASELDLLAYSLTADGVHLLAYAFKKSSIEDFGQNILLAYSEYLQEQGAVSDLPFDSIFIFDKLSGRHEALNVSKEIHHLHEDWRNDRYSSIGFYLDDRRGDWMRPYRLTSLFDGKKRQYIRFMKSQNIESDRVFEYLEH